MLKKLAKYGNSTTLVIDKAILELLNMDESSIVKLQTDGKSLIITPVASTIPNKISYENSEALVAANQSFKRKHTEALVAGKQSFDKETMAKVEQEFKDVFQKHAKAFTQANHDQNQEFQNAIADLIQKIDPIDQSEAFLKEYNSLRLQFYPELTELHKEIEAITKKYSSRA